MNPIAYHYGFAGLFHDIGKLSQRARVELSPETEALRESGWHTQRANQPYSYLHALHTRQFFDLEAVSRLMAGYQGTSVEDSVANLAARHHNPSCAAQWIIAAADHLSSGMDRVQKESEDGAGGSTAYRKTYIRPVFEKVHIRDGGSSPESEYRHALNGLIEGDGEAAPLARTFPFKKGEMEPPEGEWLDPKNKALWDGLIAEMDALSRQPTRSPLHLCLSVQSILERYTWCVPSSTVDFPDISLYDHLASTSGFAAVLAKYHHETGTWTESHIKDGRTEKFRLISGDMSGIQRFIFGLPVGATKKAAVQLRARSFLVGAITRAVVLAVLQRLELPPTAVLTEAAGQFVMLAPNTDATAAALKAVRRELHEWLLDQYQGELSLNLNDAVTARGEDFHIGRFAEGVIEPLRQANQRAKRSKMLSVLAGEDGGKWLPERFVLKPHVERKDDASESTLDLDELPKCFEKIGSKLPNTVALRWRLGDAAEGPKTFPMPLGLSLELASGHAPPPNDVLLTERIEWTGNEALDPIRLLPKHIPVFEEEDLVRGECKFCSEAKNGHCDVGSDEAGGRRVHAGTPRTFECLGKLALERVEGDWRGRELVGVLKADVDDLGQIFSRGLRKPSGQRDRTSAARHAMMSRMLNQFFAGYLQQVMRGDDEFRHIYTVFAGGDDLFLVGPWRTMIDFAQFMYDEFRRFTCRNPDITISAGIHICKSSYPIRRAADAAEECLEQSKAAGKDRITLFGTTVRWDEMPELNGWRDFLGNAVRSKNSNIKTAFLHRLLTYREMAIEADNGNLRALLWHSHFRYDVGRNIERRDGKKLVNEDEIDRLRGLASNPKLLKKINIPVCETLNRLRGGSSK